MACGGRFEAFFRVGLKFVQKHAQQLEKKTETKLIKNTRNCQSGSPPKMRKRISSKAHDNPSSQNKKKAEDEAAIVHSAEALQGSVCGRICSHIFASAQSIWPHVWAANCDNLQKNT